MVNNKITKIVMLLALISMISVASAQTKQDSDAKKLLDEVSAKVETSKPLEAAFIYRTEDANGKIISTKKGTVSIKEEKYRVSLGELEIFSDGKTSSSYDKTANEVTIKNAKSSSSSMTPEKLFTNFHDESFFYKLNGEKKEGAKTLQEVDMASFDKTKSFKKVYLMIDKQSKRLYSAKFLEKSGNSYTYIINLLKPSATIEDGIFVFNRRLYPGVKVIDLR